MFEIKWTMNWNEEPLGIIASGFATHKDAEDCAKRIGIVAPYVIEEKDDATKP
jgi:hypothetical protein